MRMAARMHAEASVISTLAACLGVLLLRVPFSRDGLLGAYMQTM